MLDAIIAADIAEKARALFAEIDALGVDDRVSCINQIRRHLSLHSPFANEPIDCVLWVKNDAVQANDYNPNSVAPPEMELLRLSILNDGYTQPVVAWPLEDGYEVVDGFHRTRVGKEFKDVRKRVHGYLPLSIIKAERTDRGDRIASTIRHNRARGKHQVEAMSDIVLELKRRNWSDKKIGQQLGMDADEVLRLTQISGLAEMFADQDFSEAWESDASINENDNLSLDCEVIPDEAPIPAL